jgi:hypothetical protein
LNTTPGGRISSPLKKEMISSLPRTLPRPSACCSTFSIARASSEAFAKCVICT